MKRYLLFYVEVEHEQSQPKQIFYNIYHDGFYEKACVYEENGDISHELKSGNLLIKSLFLLEDFIQNRFIGNYCLAHAMDDKYYTLVSYEKNGSILHETQGYLTPILKEVLKYLP